MFKEVGIFVFIYFCSLSVSAQWFKNSFQVMGTQAHVEFWLDDTAIEIDLKGKKLITAVQAEMKRIDNQMSPYKEASELSVINRNAGISAVSISKELFDLLSVAQDISILSAGAFDITYASVGYQYDYRKHQRPNKKAISRSIKAIDYSAI